MTEQEKIAFHGRIVSDFLGQLEMQEASLLSWGLVDGGFAEEELQDAARDFRERLTNENQQFFDDLFPDPGELVEFLEDSRLIFQVSGTLFRTRMAETVRLMARLRQLFPQHLAGNTWQAAPTLVSDFRFQLRRREVPDRNLMPDAVMSRAEQAGNLGAAGREVLNTLLRSKSASPLRLSEFQARSTESVLADLAGTRSRGTIVCSGTGSGKTLAFYLPALTRIADVLDTTYWTKCLAIYPRKELLKDQFVETYRQARHIDEALTRTGARKLIIGALFGPTPFSGTALVENIRKGWERDWGISGTGLRCPYMECPQCGGSLTWNRNDALAEREILRCQTGCGVVIGEDEIMLTRKRMQQTPPDILFTTTEMLNQRLGDSYTRHLFGVGRGVRRKPELVLLDEVHTYSGIQGAQVAMLLRRWRRASGARPHFVGLSATLRDARSFFARLTALNESQVDEIAPAQQDLKKVGMEYLLALRNDPVSGASVVSTTIQAAMLLGRVLTPRGRETPGNLYGKRVFVFTDDLDVTNRLYYKLLDAEGCDSWGRVLPAALRPGGSLANLRSSTLPYHGQRSSWGQSWDLCETIGHRLQPREHLHIGRTSSQDSGVSDSADVIVATSSLEVGFNDPTVGAVIQHKAPHDMAQFLQRKGRAGRDPRMRPWTVVVLSDYGRDRLTYQGYDLLFDPDLTPRSLPVENRYVLRMQAVYAFMDWIADRLPDYPKGSVWQDFSCPAKANNGERQEQAANIVEAVLSDELKRDELTTYLREALRLDDTVLSSILWDPPRALLTAVLPTLLRRLRSGWSLGGRQGFDRKVRNNPLPEFVPSTLFSELNLPEVVLSIPAHGRQVEAKEESMGILQAMRDFAPGRVSRRFTVEDGSIKHWIAPPQLDGSPFMLLPIEAYCAGGEELGMFQHERGGECLDIRCVRPYRMELTAPPRNVKDTSNSRLDWRTQIVPSNLGLAADIPSPSAWDGVLDGLRFYTHNQHSHLEIRRFALGAEATIKWPNGRETTSYMQFANSNEEGADPACIGYAIDVDGLAIRFRLPADLIERSCEDPILMTTLRSARFRDLVKEDSVLVETINVFRREWLTQVHTSALISLALTENLDLATACDRLRELGTEVYTEILDIIFQSLSMQEGEEDLDNPERNRQRVQQELMAVLADQSVLSRLQDLSPILWNPPDESWQTWLEERFTATLGAAVFDAAQRLCPDFDSSELILDLTAGPRDHHAHDPHPTNTKEIWITETNPGGGGFIEELLARYGEDPRRFLGLMESALEASEFEVMDSNLTALLELLNEPKGQAMRDGMARVRSSQTHGELTAAMKELVMLMARQGLAVTHPVMTALNTRLLQPGSSKMTDDLMLNLVRNWKTCEARLGVEVDARIFAYVSSRTDELDQALGGVLTIGPGQDRRQWRYGVISGLLWPRGQLARAQGLLVRNPFLAIPLPERDLVRRFLRGYPTIVNINEVDWKAKASSIVSRDGAVVIRAAASEVESLKAAILRMVTVPADAGFLFLYPRIRGVRNRSAFTDILLEASEVL